MGRRNFTTYFTKVFLKKGVTLIEMIVILAILVILIFLVVTSLKPQVQLAKSRDSRRKADLKRISTALEDYAGDHPCYPEQIYDLSKKCSPSEEIKDYLSKIPCDPLTGEKYNYVRPDGCAQFALYASLELEEPKYGTANYVVTSSNVVDIPSLPTPTEVNTGISGGEETTPFVTPSVASNYYGCFSGECLPIAGPWVCPKINYLLPDCGGKCSYPENQCQ